MARRQAIDGVGQVAQPRFPEPAAQVLDHAAEGVVGAVPVPHVVEELLVGDVLLRGLGQAGQEAERDRVAEKTGAAAEGDREP